MRITVRTIQAVEKLLEGRSLLGRSKGRRQTKRDLQNSQGSEDVGPRTDFLGQPGDISPTNKLNGSRWTIQRIHWQANL